MPMPGPMAAAPYTMPAPIDCKPALSSPACCAARSSRDMVFSPGFCVLEPDEQVDEVGLERQVAGDAHARRGRELDARDDLPDVQEQDPQEQRAEERCVACRVVAHDITRDAVVDELVGHLDHVLEPA